MGFLFGSRCPSNTGLISDRYMSNVLQNLTHMDTTLSDLFFDANLICFLVPSLSTSEYVSRARQGTGFAFRIEHRKYRVSHG